MADLCPYALVALVLSIQADRHIITFSGCADASAAALLADGLIAVAEDEDNVIRLYKLDGGPPVASLDLSSFLMVDPKFPEVDIEGAARVGNRVYWISSHGRNKDGKLRPSRYRFFATDIEGDGGQVRLRPVGRPYTRLLTRILAAKEFSGLGLQQAAGADLMDQALRESDRKRLAPKDEGINIEGICGCPDGRMYVGFRNPIPKGKALVIPILNPEPILLQGEDPVFDRPILLDLAGMGIRDLCYVQQADLYYIVAGPADETKGSVLYRWSGRASDRPRKVMDLQSVLADWTAESIIPLGPDKAIVLSDDGSRLVKVDGPQDCKEGQYLPEGLCPNKALLDPARRTFRGILLATRDL